MAKNMADALAFVKLVREAFKDRHPDKYELFLHMIIDFKNQRIDTNGVSRIARRLFRDEPALATRFNVFLPEGYKLQVDKIDDLAACLVQDMSLDDEYC